MSTNEPNFKVGDLVCLLRLPDWLTHDLPLDEQKSLQSFVGRQALVSEVDSYGYVWLGFGETVEFSSHAEYTGHSFAVTEDCLCPAINRNVDTSKSNK